MFINNLKSYNFPKLGYIKIPKVTIPQSDILRLNLTEGCDSNQYLEALYLDGFNQKLKSGLIPDDRKHEYLKRIEFEFSEIKKLLFTDYILLIYNILKFCKENEILNSPGRGSAAGSLLLWIIDVVKVDALKNGLMFERFISAGRTESKEIDGQLYISSKNVPDVDIDNDRSLKYKVNKFIESQFPGQTCAIKTFNTLQGKAAIKEVLKCYENFNEDEAKEVSDLIEVSFGKVQEISDAAENNDKFKAWSQNHKEATLIAQKLNGLIRGASVHASGIILCEDKLEDCLPLELSASAGDKVIISSFDMEGSQSIGIKIDNLGLKNLEAIKECLDLIGKKMEDIDVNDESIYTFLNNTDCYRGIFQAEEGLGKAVLRKIKSNNIEDVCLSISVGRPGSLMFLDEIIDSKFNGSFKTIDKRIKDILSPTFNVIVYQEQIMALSRVMANFNAQEADGLRKGVGKKIVEKILEYKDKFINNSIKNGYEEKFVRSTWQTFVDSGNYLFNKCLFEESLVETIDGKVKMKEISIGDKIKAFDIKKNANHFVEVKNIYHNQVEVYEVELENGKKISCSLDHKLLCRDMRMRTLREILIHNHEIATDE